MSIHPTAILSAGARIGAGVEIGPYAFVGQNAVLGDGCRIHHHATIEGYTTLGDNCEVYPQAVLGTPPQDVKYAGERTELRIGKNNVFREMVTVHPGTGNGGGVTQIGNDNLFLVGVHVAHDCRIGNRCIIANYVQFAGHVHLEDHVNMGGHSAVHHFVTIGRHAFVGGVTRVSYDVPPYMVVVAARGTRTEVRMVNGVGLERSGYRQEDIAALKNAYARLFSRRARLGGTGIRERVQALLDEGQTNGLNPHVQYLCEFLMRSFAHGRHGRYLESLRADPVHRKSWTVGAAGASAPPSSQAPFGLVVNVVGNGSVEQFPEPAVNHQDRAVKLMARADPGWSFAGWNGGASGRENPVNVVLDRHKTVTATFVTRRDK